MTAKNPTAILSALPEEQQGLLALLEQSTHTVHAGREYCRGWLRGQPVVLALSRMGKVAAATTAAGLIETFGVARVVFTGVAGGVGAGVQVGDVVVGDGFVQHDLNAEPLCPRFEIPLTGRTVLPGDAQLTALLHQASLLALAQGGSGRVHRGLIASGDQFISSALQSQQLVQALQAQGHEPLAVEMEGAAVAQVCLDYGVPFAAVRTISDRADDTAHLDFARFVREVASQYALRIIVNLVDSIQKS